MPNEDETNRPPAFPMPDPPPAPDTPNARKDTEKSENTGSPPPPRMYNRVHAILVHCPRYSFEGPARLAKDVGCSRSTISRLIREKTRPSYALVEKVTAALSKALGRPLEAPEVFSLDGRFPTRSGCALCGCKGCLPEEAYDARSNLRPAFKNMRPGDWSLAPKRPRGEP